MFSIVKTLRVCRSRSNFPNPSEYFSYLRNNNKFCGLMGKPNLHCQFEVGQKRLSSTSADPNLDPLSDCHTIYPLNKVQIEDLTGNEPQQIKKLKILQMELAVKRVQQTRYMPVRITLDQWRNLLSLSRTAQMKYLVTIRKKENRYTEKVAPESNNPCDFETWNNGHELFEHKLFRNAMFPMLHQNAISSAMNSRLVNAIQFSPHLIIDCDYGSIMSVREIKNLCQQLALCINLNRTARKSYNMVLCNLMKDTMMAENLWAAISNIYEDYMPLITTESCYTKFYPKEKLVYLTPHCRETVEFNPNDVYIVGAMVDKSNPGPHSLIKAKAQGLRMGSFPLDRYLVWKKGTKSLTIDQVFRIMSKMLQTGDWAQSFNAIPKRKIADIVSFRSFDKRHRKFEF